MSATLTESGTGLAGFHAQMIHPELNWVDPPGGGPLPQSRIVASRWTDHANELRAQEAAFPTGHRVISIALHTIADVTLYAGQNLIHSGPLPRGSVWLNEPEALIRGILRGAYDVLHLSVPDRMIGEYANREERRDRSTPEVAGRPIVDPVIEGLARSFIHAETLGGAYGANFADGIGLAITARLFGRDSHEASTGRTPVTALPKWRLKRATDYIAANYSEPISLADIAAAAGLSRMHFAAQFRTATGLRPHEFLVRRRIERAQELLSNSRMPLVEIAFKVGFKTQAHFTTVFAREVGETPNVWRQRGHGMSEIAMLKAA